MNDHLTRAMRELRTDEEIDEYIRKMIWVLYVRCGGRGMHREYFHMVRMSISDSAEALIKEDYRPPVVMTSNYPITHQAIGVMDNWIHQVYSMENTTILREEVYDVSEGVCQLKYWMEARDEYHTLIEEVMKIITGDNIGVTVYVGAVMVIYFERVMSTLRDGWIKMYTTIIEYDDYYEERQGTGDTETKRVIWKRDLFRNELHTIPFKAIHEEMMYSLDTPMFFQNEARRAQQHFDGLTHSSPTFPDASQRKDNLPVSVNSHRLTV